MLWDKTNSGKMHDCMGVQWYAPLHAEKIGNFYSISRYHNQPIK